MALSVREPAIIAGRLRLRGEVISEPSEIAEARQRANFDFHFVEIPDAEISAVAPSKLPSTVKESD